MEISPEVGLDFLAVQWFFAVYIARRKGILKSDRIVGVVELVGVAADLFGWQRAGGGCSCLAAKAFALPRRALAFADSRMPPQMV
jgi:hypothetical protein